MAKCCCILSKRFPFLIFEWCSSKYRPIFSRFVITIIMVNLDQRINSSTTGLCRVKKRPPFTERSFKNALNGSGNYNPSTSTLLLCSFFFLFKLTHGCWPVRLHAQSLMQGSGMHIPVHTQRLQTNCFSPTSVCVFPHTSPQMSAAGGGIGGTMLYHSCVLQRNCIGLRCGRSAAKSKRIRWTNNFPVLCSWAVEERNHTHGCALLVFCFLSFHTLVLLLPSRAAPNAGRILLSPS